MVGKPGGQINLNAEQVQALQQLYGFLAASEPIFILKGYAGTGKTTLIGCLVEYLEKIERNYQLIAPTGRAARNLKERIRRRATTIHKAIYTYNRTEPASRGSQSEPELLLFDFSLRRDDDDRDTVYLVDEASMVSDVKSEAGYLAFGSGKLLTDLLKYTGIGLKGIRRKIIFVGDPAQLPPVNMNISPALSADYLKENFSIKAVPEFLLTKIERQEQTSGILQLAAAIRRQIELNQYLSFNVNINATDIGFLDSNSLVDKYFAQSDPQSDVAVIITYSNQSAYGYNCAIRERLFADSSLIQPGDRIIVVQNNYYNGIELLNGEFGTVEWVCPQREEKVVKIKRSAGEQKVVLYFRKVRIQFLDATGTEFSIQCNILENLLNSPHPGLSPEEFQALVVDFYRRHSNIARNDFDLSTAWRNDPYVNALQIKYGYAITGHKAQGGEWQKVFVDFGYAGNKLCADYFRWVYTAVTRAQERLFLLNYEVIDISQGIREDLLQSENFGVETSSPMSENSAAFVTWLNQEVERIGGAMGWQVNSVDALAYRQRYYLEKGDTIVRVDVVYRKSLEVSQVEVAAQSDEAAELVAALNRLKGAKPVASEPAEKNPEMAADKPFLKELEATVRQKVLVQGIEIVAVEHFDYMVRYTFRREGKQVRMDFYYNSRGRFTKTQASGKKNDPQLLQQIREGLCTI